MSDPDRDGKKKEELNSQRITYLAILFILVANHDKRNMHVQDIYLDKAGSDRL